MIAEWVDASGRPQANADVSRHQLEVTVRGEHHELVPATQLRKERVDGADLDALPAARVAKVGRLDMVRSIGHEQWQRREALHDRVTSLGPTEALQQFLQHEPGREDPLPTRGPAQPLDGRLGAWTSRRKASDHTLVSTKRSTQRVRSAL